MIKFHRPLCPWVMLLAMTMSFSAAAYTPACYRQVKQFCGDVEPGNGRLTDCVARNQHQFSAACRPEAHAAIEQLRSFKAACKANSEQLCPGIKGGQGRLYACLRFNEERLTQSCRQQLE